MDTTTSAQHQDTGRNTDDSRPDRFESDRPAPGVLSTRADPGAAPEDDGMAALRAYLRRVALIPDLAPGDSAALCRQIEAAHRALASALLDVPSAACRLQHLHALAFGVDDAAANGRLADAAEIVDALHRLVRQRCVAVATVHVDAAIDGGRVDRADRPELLRATDSRIAVTPFRPAYIERLAADIAPVTGSPSPTGDAVALRLAQLRRLKSALLTSSLPLVVSLAVRYRHPDVPLLRLILEGNHGLEMAVDRFEYREGADFAAYAAGWIRQALVGVLRRAARQ